MNFLSRPLSFAIACSFALISATQVFAAGGLSRDGQDVSFMYEDGDFAAISLRSITPSVTGTSYTPVSADEMAPAIIPTSVGESYSTYNINYRKNSSGKGAIGFQVRTPIGADLLYPSGSVLAGTSVDYDSLAISLLGSYNTSREVKLIGGITSQSQNAEVSIPFQAYTASASRDSGTGFILGAAYSIPEIAFRASTTYFSEISTSHATLENGLLPSTTEITSPKGINIDIQSGIMEDTLAFVSIVYQDWDATIFDPVGWRANAGSALYDPESATTYTVGLGRKFSDTIAGSVSYTLKEETDGTASALAPTDGYQDISLGLRYSLDKVEIGVGGTYRTYTNDVATTQMLAPGMPIGNFTKNSLTGVGISMKYKY
jgi:long-subunit fatty acid transport protein